jgi:antitoxin component YwqK of YwqJK toxin-antitoxin module
MTAPSPLSAPAPPDGQVLQHDEAGVLRTRATIAEGVLHGPLTVFDENGRITLEEHYVRGKLDGARHLLVAGRPHTLARFQAGLQHGETRHYHASTGAVAAKLPFVHGKLHGEATWFDADGNLARKATYHAGKLHGGATSFYPQGPAFSHEPYVNDLLHGESKWFSPDGSVVNTRKFNMGKPEHPASPLQPSPHSR